MVRDTPRCFPNFTKRSEGTAGSATRDNRQSALLYLHHEAYRGRGGILQVPGSDEDEVLLEGNRGRRQGKGGAKKKGRGAAQQQLVDELGEESDEEDELARWEREQIRKGVSSNKV